MAYLYQEIMNVPGLSGTWQERNRQLYQKLGAPLGSYKGNYQQNIWLLNQIKDNNYFKGGFPGEQKAQVTATAQQAAQPKTLAMKYTDPLTGQVKSASEIPQYENVLPFMEAWEKRLQPGAIETGKSVIAPEVQRNYNQAYRDYMAGMTSSGGQRFGRGLAGLGNLKAASERSYKAQLQDWLGQQRSGFEELWYNPQKSIWNESRTQVQPGGTMEQVKVPTWEEYYAQNDPIGSSGNSTSLFYS